MCPQSEFPVGDWTTGCRKHAKQQNSTLNSPVALKNQFCVETLETLFKLSWFNSVFALASPRWCDFVSNCKQRAHLDAIIFLIALLCPSFFLFGFNNFPLWSMCAHSAKTVPATAALLHFALPLRISCSFCLSTKSESSHSSFCTSQSAVRTSDTLSA